MSATPRTTSLENLWSMLALPLDDEPGATGERRIASLAGRAGRTLPSASKALSAGQAYAIVKRGIPSRMLTPLGEYLGLGKGAVAVYLDLDRATATRKVAKDEMLPTHAAESMLRLLELDRLAEETFETPEEASTWLRQPHPMLDGESPLDCAKSGFGAQRVKDILNAVKYGGVV